MVSESRGSALVSTTVFLSAISLVAFMATVVLIRKQRRDWRSCDSVRECFRRNSRFLAKLWGVQEGDAAPEDMQREMESADHMEKGTIARMGEEEKRKVEAGEEETDGNEQAPSENPALQITTDLQSATSIAAENVSVRAVATDAATDRSPTSGIAIFDDDDDKDTAQ